MDKNFNLQKYVNDLNEGWSSAWSKMNLEELLQNNDFKKLAGSSIKDNHVEIIKEVLMQQKDGKNEFKKKNTFILAIKKKKKKKKI